MLQVKDFNGHGRVMERKHELFVAFDFFMIGLPIENATKIYTYFNFSFMPHCTRLLKSALTIAITLFYPKVLYNFLRMKK